MGGCCSCFEPPDEWSILQQAKGGEKGAGFLYKRAKSKAIWSNRFFVLTNTKLIYYGGEDRAEAKGEIVLAGAIAQNSTTRANSKKKFYFQISHPECGMREFYAVSNNRRNQWVNIINDMSNVLRPLSQYGKMYKQGGLAKSSWQERWCICVGNDLDYFENASENQPKGSISKKGMKKYVFCVETEGERSRWMAAFNRATSPNALDPAINAPSPSDRPSQATGSKRDEGSAKKNLSVAEGVNPLHDGKASNSAASSSSASAGAPKGGGGGGALSSMFSSGAAVVDASMGSSLRESIVTVSEVPEEMRGYLMKKSPNAFSGYQKRYFVLRDPGVVTYYGSEEDAKKGKEAKGTISIAEVTSAEAIEYGGKFEFVIKAGKRDYPLKAATVDEAEEWVAALQRWQAFLKSD